jgi:hypothetical protein
VNTPAVLFPLPAYLWQVTLHSWVMGLILYVWVRRNRVPSGRSKRRLLILLLTLPFATAAVPGRATPDFGARVAWFDSARVLAIPLGHRWHLADVFLLLFGLTVLVTIWQHVAPWQGRPRTVADPPPESLIAMARSFRGWSTCRVRMSPSDAVLVASRGWPARAQLIVSRGALAALTPPELELATAHEHARSTDWTEIHVVFVAHVLQCYNPISLLAFRKYCLEVEIGCDARATAGRDPNALARVLLKAYQSTDRGDFMSRGTLRRRVDILFAGGADDHALPIATLAGAAVVLLLVLPWIV